ncbi:hypothetical protein ACFL1V_01470 [Pseudomonadota bacterium]
MKSIIIAFIFLTLSTTAFSEVRPEYSGAWYNPAQSGHGFSIDVISAERSLAFWYAYDPFGNPIFLYAEGVNVGNKIEAQVYVFQGMVFGEFDPDTNQLFEWGTLTITFHDCGNATLEYDSTLQYESGETFGSGQMPLTHLASIEEFRCSDYPVSGIYGGWSLESNIVYFGNGIVNELGGISFISSDGVLVFGQLSVTSGRFGQLTMSGSAVDFSSGTPVVADVTANGSFAPDGIGVEYRNPLTGQTGQLIMYKRNELTTRSVLYTDLQGNWTAFNVIFGTTGPATISGNGSISATDDFGCNYNGQIAIPNPERNILEVSLTVTGCNETSGTFTGNGFYDDGQDVLVLAGWNGVDGAGAFTLTRN